MDRSGSAELSALSFDDKALRGTVRAESESNEPGSRPTGSETNREIFKKRKISFDPHRTDMIG
jgi:hypothetical protein